ncbi:hypothetical protein EYF80_000188 [Liparis tanakae]|uniref:Uncharacterized protein n=1 Tax=Liparis tanakae TaxID=230148 RepID=A0A4Z2JH45_9TELE|nr:hypothetical protein EYF80_000188 [Liparis tanakae]
MDHIYNQKVTLDWFSTSLSNEGGNDVATTSEMVEVLSKLMGVVRVGSCGVCVGVIDRPVVTTPLYPLEEWRGFRSSPPGQLLLTKPGPPQ